MERKAKQFFSLPMGFIKSLFEMSKVGARYSYLCKRYKGTKFGFGCNADENCKFECDVTVGSYVILSNCKFECGVKVDSYVGLSNCEIGRYTYIGSHSNLQNVKIGRFCSLAGQLLVGLGIHPVGKNVSTSPTFYRVPAETLTLLDQTTFYDEYKQIIIGSDVWIGARSIILGGVEIGHGAVVAAGAVVTKNVPPYAIVGGVPAKIIRYRFSQDIIAQLLKISWWDCDIKWLKEKCNLFDDVERFVKEND